MKPLTIWKQNSIIRHNKAVTTFTLQCFSLLQTSSPSSQAQLHPAAPQLVPCVSQAPGLRQKVVPAPDRERMHSCLLSVSRFGHTFDIEPENQQLHGQSAETVQCLYETHLLSSSRPTSPSHVQSSFSIIKQYYYHLIKIFLPQFSLKIIINYLFVAIALSDWCYWCRICPIFLSVTIVSCYAHLK